MNSLLTMLGLAQPAQAVESVDALSMLENIGKIPTKTPIKKPIGPLEKKVSDKKYNEGIVKEFKEKADSLKKEYESKVQNVQSTASELSSKTPSSMQEVFSKLDPRLIDQINRAKLAPGGELSMKEVSPNILSDVDAKTAALGAVQAYDILNPSLDREKQQQQIEALKELITNKIGNIKGAPLAEVDMSPFLNLADKALGSTLAKTSLGKPIDIKDYTELAAKLSNMSANIGSDVGKEKASLYGKNILTPNVMTFSKSNPVQKVSSGQLKEDTSGERLAKMPQFKELQGVKVFSETIDEALRNLDKIAREPYSQKNVDLYLATYAKLMPEIRKEHGTGANLSEAEKANIDRALPERVGNIFDPSSWFSGLRESITNTVVPILNQHQQRLIKHGDDLSTTLQYAFPSGKAAQNVLSAGRVQKKIPQKETAQEKAARIKARRGI